MITTALPEAHFRGLERVFRASLVNADGRTELRVGHGVAELTLTFVETDCHAAGAVHGACVFKLLDDAAFFAASSVADDAFLATASFTLQLVRPALPGPVVATGTLTQAGRRVAFAESRLCDAEGRLLACGTGVFLRSHVALDAVPGYRVD